jgi:hypothetical protein
MAIPKIEYSINAEFHLLRHFEIISDQLMQRLTEAGFSAEVCKRELNQPGSKFYGVFATDIGQLMYKLQESDIQQSIGLNGNIIFSAIMNHNKYPLGIGSMGVVSLNDLSSNERSRIYLSDNRGYKIQHLNTTSLPSTLECTLIAKNINNSIQLITCFPGPAALPVPDKKMDQTLFEKCSKYWDEHVFLVKKNDG